MGKPRDIGESEGKIVIYRRHFERLLAEPKPLRDQIVLELSALQGLRSGEISSLRVGYVDFERGDLQVLDSKKLKLCMIPLHPILAAHLAEYIKRKGLCEDDLVVQALPGAPHVGHKEGSGTLGVGLSINTINNVWRKWCARCHIPYMTSRVGRAYFATVWHFVLHKSMFGLMAVLRHDSIQSTEHYLDKLVCYEDTKVEFYVGLKSPFSSGCARAESCPMSCEDCHCKFYQPRIEEHLHADEQAPSLRVPVSKQIP